MAIKPPPSTWITAQMLTNVTGWSDSEKLRARRLNLINYRFAKGGGYEYELQSIPEQLIKQLPNTPKTKDMTLPQQQFITNRINKYLQLTADLTKIGPYGSQAYTISGAQEQLLNDLKAYYDDVLLPMKLIYAAEYLRASVAKFLPTFAEAQLSNHDASQIKNKPFFHQKN
ncbi:MAG: hypothetical protein SFU21_09955 [Flavihumibacter sp.]|nr:hypothetical protein [Flavihumibacter sp.]